MLHHKSSDLKGCLWQSKRKCHANFARCKKQVSSTPPIARDLALLCLSGGVTDHTAFVLITKLELNSVTKPDTFMLPCIDDLFDQLESVQYFSTLDLATGYWQIGLHPASCKKAAFVTSEGLYEFCVMLFGPMDPPAAFQWLMQQLLMGENGDLFASVYKDDVLISPIV